MDVLGALGGALLGLVGGILFFVWVIALHTTTKNRNDSAAVGCALWILGAMWLGCFVGAFSILS